MENYLEIFCSGDLSIFLHLVIQLYIYISIDLSYTSGF